MALPVPVLPPEEPEPPLSVGAGVSALDIPDTRTSHLAVAPASSVTVSTVQPLATAVTRPLSETVATLGLPTE